MATLMAMVIILSFLGSCLALGVGDGKEKEIGPCPQEVHSLVERTGPGEVPHFGGPECQVVSDGDVWPSTPPFTDVYRQPVWAGRPVVVGFTGEAA